MPCIAATAPTAAKHAVVAIPIGLGESELTSAPRPTTPPRSIATPATTNRMAAHAGVGGEYRVPQALHLRSFLKATHPFGLQVV